MKNLLLLFTVCLLIFGGTFAMSYHWVTTECDFTVQESAYIKPAQ